MKHKYPRTFHVDWSEGLSNCDKKIKHYNGFVGREIVVTLKMDGENTSCYHDGSVHARSLDSQHHPSRDWVKKFWGENAYKLPPNWRVCGENLYARHSIGYNDLPSYFMGFSIWNERNVSLSWDDTLMWFEELGITPVQQLYRGQFDLAKLRQITARLDTKKEEGIVVRVAGEIQYDDFEFKVAKWVRNGHVQTAEHWMHSEIVPNGLNGLL